MTERFVSIEVPFRRIGNERVLTDMQLAEDPFLADFVSRFRHCFERDHVRFIWLYRPS